MKLEDQAHTNITDPHDTDVLCGRGGAVNRHPGNKNYLDLVHLNKGHYTTCPAVEKHMISRSIVLAIRELRGRFLEKNNIDGTWSDIGNKKATEKTSQALRERQSEMRQNVSSALEESHFAIQALRERQSEISAIQALRERQSEMRQNLSGALEESHFATGSDSSHMSGTSMDAFPGGADISTIDHALSVEKRLLHQQRNNLLLSGMIPSAGGNIGSEPAPWSISDFSLMSGIMSMDAFLHGTLNLSKRNISNLSDGINPDTDRRQVFAAMSSIRATPIEELRGPNIPVSQPTMEGALVVNPVESTLSLCSNMSIMSIE
jgi:hypothetical protein